MLMLILALSQKGLGFGFWTGKPLPVPVPPLSRRCCALYKKMHLRTALKMINHGKMSSFASRHFFLNL
jgi:hypothetical protein